jgi:alkaline phosphatase
MPYEHDGSYDTLPHLSEMTTAALEFLQPDPDGLFLVVEGGLIDWAAHGSGLANKSDPLRLERTVAETLEFGRAVQSVLDWAGDRNDTLVLVTADHETGGLDFSVTTDADGNPVVKALWSTTGHTGVNVPLYAWGPGAQNFSGLIDNTDLFQMSTVSVPEPSAAILLTTGVLAGGLLWITRRRRAI